MPYRVKKLEWNWNADSERASENDKTKMLCHSKRPPPGPGLGQESWAATFLLSLQCPLRVSASTLGACVGASMCVHVGWLWGGEHS